MTATPTAATPTPEELARKLRAGPIYFPDDDPHRIPPVKEAATKALMIEGADLIEALRAEIERLTEALERAEKLLTADLSLLRMGPSELGFTMETSGRMVAVIAGQLATWLEAHHAENYTETAFEQIDISGGARSYTLTVQRGEGKTPHQLRKEAEAALSASQERERGMREALTVAYDLSTWAACINWRARNKDNQGEWLDELKELITRTQQLVEPLIKEQPAAALAKEAADER